MITDIRYAIRGFSRTPGFTLTAILTLALGIGATTAMFSVVNAVLLEPLPYPAAERLVVTRGSLPDLRDLQQASRSFEDSAIWATNLYNLRLNGESRQVLGAVISSNLLPLLDVKPVLGQGFSRDDLRPDTVILSHGLWQRQFGADPAVIGRRIELSGMKGTIIGVAPAWFRFPSAEFQLWTRLDIIESMAPAQAKNRALRIFQAIARLREGVTLQQARAEAEAISAQLARTYPSTNASIEFRVRSLYDQLVGDTRPALKMLLGTVGLLLLIACANVANLMLARTAVREREMAIRSALGARRGRLVRQLATESLVLATFGGVFGLLLAMWGVDILPSLLEARVPRAEGIRIDGAVLTFAFGATVLTGLFFGLAPALQASMRASTSLKESSRGVAGTSTSGRLRAAIVIGEIAMAVIVIVGAGLLARSFAALTSQDVGFEPQNVITFNVQLVAIDGDRSRGEVATRLFDRLATLPGVDAVGGATGLPTVTAQRGTRFEIDGRQLTPDESGALFIGATPGYFAALRTPVLRGRPFASSDAPRSQPVAIVNRALADTLFPNEDPVGRRLRLINPEQTPEWRTIVGVVGDVQYRGLGEEPVPTVYTPFAQTPFLWVYVMVRATGSPDALLASLRSIVPSVDPKLTAADVRLFDDVIASSAATPRLNMLLVSGFAMLALVLAAVGIYGVIAYSVAQRTREIGVRIALGAGRVDVVRLVLKEGLVLAVAGTLLGVGAAAALSRMMRTLLFGVSERDPMTFAAGALLLFAVAMLACYLPARRALRVDPISALRAE
jgi:predicted permease